MKKFLILIGIIIVFWIGISFIQNYQLFDFFSNNNLDKSISCGSYDCAIETKEDTYEVEFNNMENNLLIFSYNSHKYATKLVLTADYDTNMLEDFLSKSDKLKIEYEYIEDGVYFSWVYLIDDNNNEFLLQELLLQNNAVSLMDNAKITKENNLSNSLIESFPNVPLNTVANESVNLDFFNFFDNLTNGSDNTYNDLSNESKTEQATSTSETNIPSEYINNKEINVDACNLSGDRESNVKVDIGMDTKYKEREYYAYTNEYAQLTYVYAEEIILQNDTKEADFEKGDSRYCSDEAKVDGTESSTLDEGHAIADSLGGVSNAYNITPQDSQLNRKGEQYDMEEVIRDAEANGKEVTNFQYYIYYPNNNTMIPSSYSVSYEVDGNPVNLTYENK